MKKTAGVMDSGVGGLTVVKEILRIMPDADIIYFGDSKNCPYGNKTSDEIFALSCNMINFLRSKGAQCIVIACNTISVLAEELRKNFDLPIISIVECTVRRVIEQKLKNVALIATEFTINSGEYQRLIADGAPDCRVAAMASHNLAALIDRGDFNTADINGEIHDCLDDVTSQDNISHLILGCTHYPIAEKNFRSCYPGLELINPAVDQAVTVAGLLKCADTGNGSFSLYTSGSAEGYISVIKKLGIQSPGIIETISL